MYLCNSEKENIESLFIGGATRVKLEIIWSTTNGYIVKTLSCNSSFLLVIKIYDWRKIHNTLTILIVRFVKRARKFF